MVDLPLPDIIEDTESLTTDVKIRFTDVIIRTPRNEPYEIIVPVERLKRYNGEVASAEPAGRIDRDFASIAGETVTIPRAGGPPIEISAADIAVAIGIFCIKWYAEDKAAGKL